MDRLGEEYPAARQLPATVLARQVGNRSVDLTVDGGNRDVRRLEHSGGQSEPPLGQDGPEKACGKGDAAPGEGGSSSSFSTPSFWLQADSEYCDNVTDRSLAVVTYCLLFRR